MCILIKYMFSKQHVNNHFIFNVFIFCRVLTVMTRSQRYDVEMTHFTFTVGFQHHEAIMKNTKLLLFLLVDKKKQWPFQWRTAVCLQNHNVIWTLSHILLSSKYITVKLLCLDNLLRFHLCVMHSANLKHANRTNARLQLLHTLHSPSSGESKQQFVGRSLLCNAFWDWLLLEGYTWCCLLELGQKSLCTSTVP